MDKANASVLPEFNSALLFGMLSEPFICKPILQTGINKLTKLFLQQHPKVITKMAEFSPARLVLVPADMPFCFFVEFTKDSLQINIIDSNAYSGSNLTIVTASLEVFIKMLEGDLDGDALFFSRQLMVEGDTTIVVALRNILEAESVNIKKDVNETLGVFAAPFNFFINLACVIYNDIDDNLSSVKSSIVSKLDQQIISQSSKHEQLVEEVKKLDKQVGILSAKTKSLRLQLKDKDKE